MKNKGITLIALIISIIILLILAGTSIALLIGENGILSKTQTAKRNTEIAEIEEELALAIQDGELNYQDGTNTNRINAYENAIESNIEGATVDYPKGSSPITGTISKQDSTIYYFEINVDTKEIEVSLEGKINPNDIIYISNNSIWRKSGEYSSYQLYNTNNVKELFETEKINEVKIADNVVAINENYFLTKDGTIYYQSMDNKCLENVKSIQKMNYNWNWYWLVNNQRLYSAGMNNITDFSVPLIEEEKIINILNVGTSFKNDENFIYWVNEKNEIYKMNLYDKNRIRITEENILSETAKDSYWIGDGVLYIRPHGDYDYSIIEIGNASEVYWPEGKELYQINFNGANLAYLDPTTNTLNIYQWNSYAGTRELYTDSFDLNSEAFKGKSIQCVYSLYKTSSNGFVYSAIGAIEFDNGEVYLSDGTKIDLDAYQSSNGLSGRNKLIKIDNPITYSSASRMDELKEQIINNQDNKWQNWCTVQKYQKHYMVSNNNVTGVVNKENEKWYISTYTNAYNPPGQSDQESHEGIESQQMIVEREQVYQGSQFQ